MNLPNQTSSGTRILVFEPDSGVASAIHAKLQELGYAVDVESNLKQLYNRTKDLLPALVLSEVEMPMTTQLCRRIRKDPTTKHIPVLLHTSHPTQGLIAKTLNAGATDIIERPISTASLDAKLRACLGAGSVPLPRSEAVKSVLDGLNTVDQKMESLLNWNSGLKAIPYAASRALQISDAEDSGADDLAKVMSTDVAITATILRIANSQYYSGSRSISDLGEAITRIGFDECRRILVGMSVVNMVSDANRGIIFSRKHFWKHSFACGYLAAAMAKHLNACNESVAFTAGLLHDVGKLIFDERAAVEYETALEMAAQRRIIISDAEIEVFGFSHNQLGYAYLTESNMPEEICHAALYHNSGNLDSLDLTESQLQLVKIVSQANSLAKAVGYSGAGDDMLGTSFNPASHSIQLSSGFRKDLIKNLLAGMTDCKSFLKLPDEGKTFIGTAREKKSVVYFNPGGAKVDIVDLFLEREHFRVVHSTTLDDVVRQVSFRPEDSILLVQVSQAVDLTELAVYLKTLPSPVGIICLGNKAELRILETMKAEFDSMTWPLSAGALRATLLDMLQSGSGDTTILRK